MFLLIDNYDSFTYNLVQAFYSLGHEPYVRYNDDPKLLELAESNELQMVCISPGPSRPENAGYCLEFLHKLSPKIPVLGVCLGHQILGLFGGGNIAVCQEIMHGKQSEITHDGQGLFSDLPKKLLVGRYHSLVVEETSQSKEVFKVVSKGPKGEVMGLRYLDRSWVGVQFHPESILTPEGMQLLGNFPDALERKEDDQARIAQVLDAVCSGQNLNRGTGKFIFGKLMDGELTQAQAAGFLLALRMKGESSLELACASQEVLQRSILLPEISEPHIDVVGTGGDGHHSFNCSTATALVLAGLGYKVTKHGNRAVSSTSGSADAVEGLGLPLEKEPAAVLAELKKRNFAFMFAPYFHLAFRNIASIRKELGVRTVFNILGPLLNPSKPSHILLGVAKPEFIPLMEQALLELKQKVAAIVCGAGLYDELTPIGPSTVSILRDQKVSTLAINPLDFGIKPCTPQDLEVHSKREAVSVLEDLLAGQGPGPMLDMIVLNVGLGLYILEGTEDLSLCMAKARQAVLAGVGRRVLNA
ncbi:MAG: anthranilate phosphoribosyltransferase [Desulfovibrionaceae bacterium]|nr:anthranilate phosphoribosyltransferase [Desulfovibrionaceae bacterium]